MIFFFYTKYRPSGFSWAKNNQKETLKLKFWEVPFYFSDFFFLNDNMYNFYHNSNKYPQISTL